MMPRDKQPVNNNRRWWVLVWLTALLLVIQSAVGLFWSFSKR